MWFKKGKKERKKKEKEMKELSFFLKQTNVGNNASVLSEATYSYII